MGEDDKTLEEGYESLAIALRAKQKVQRILIDGIGVLPGEHLDEFAERVVRELAQLQAEAAQLHTWQGLMSLLDEHYPPEVFDGSSGDEGPRIVALVREVDWLRREVEFEAKAEPWGPGTIVAPNGHGYINGGNCCECGHPTPTLRTYERHAHSLLRACACITDEQATRLGPSFSRPVCAVHQEVTE